MNLHSRTEYECSPDRPVVHVRPAERLVRARDSCCQYPALFGEVHVERTALLRFGMAASGCDDGVESHVFENIEAAADANYPQFFSEITTDASSRLNISHFTPPKREWITIDDCVAMDCGDPPTSDPRPDLDPDPQPCFESKRPTPETPTVCRRAQAHHHPRPRWDSARPWAGRDPVEQGRVHEHVQDGRQVDDLFDPNQDALRPRPSEHPQRPRPLSRGPRVRHLRRQQRAQARAAAALTTAAAQLIDPPAPLTNGLV